ncbi:MAG TPA: Ig-like domain-containing protein [Ignavibacteriaceae bacterium]|nr:Ig-like domain-containing protein [Ignavibacteriaceae bacterium]
MVKYTKEKIVLYSVLLLLFAVLIYGCANQLPPGGGEVDTTPPQIVEVIPENGTINFDDDYFELTFSEYVEKRSFKDAVFISPIIDGTPEISWSGKSVRYYFPEKLKEGITYNITIGTDLVDFNNKNRMSESFNLAFSTGDFIDYGSISGTVYDEKPSGVMIFAYRFEADTIDPAKHKPDYVSQVGQNGFYRFNCLAEGTYRIFAVQDEFRDLIYQPAQDKIGVPYQDIVLTRIDSLFRGMNFQLMSIDTVPPRLFSAVMTDQNHMLITFSEEVDTASIKAENFVISDSLGQMQVAPLYAFKGRTKEKELVLSFETLADPDNAHLIISKNISDKRDNITVGDTINLTRSDKPDTVVASIYSTLPASGASDVDFVKPEFSFFFDDGFNFGIIKNEITVTDTSNIPVEFLLYKLDDASFKVKVEQTLKADKEYLINFNLKNFVDAAGNKYDDSIYVFKFKTITGLEFTGLSGVVKNLDFNKNPLLVLKSKDKSSRIYKQKPDGKGNFDFSRIEPGKYFLYCFLDENSNGEYDYGFPFPYQHSENVSYYRSEINLPARWSVTNFEFIFNEEIR